MSDLAHIRKGDLDAFQALLARWGAASAAMACALPGKPDWVNLGAWLWSRLRVALESDDRSAILVATAEWCAPRAPTDTVHAETDPRVFAALVAGVALGTRPGGRDHLVELCADNPALETLRVQMEAALHAGLGTPVNSTNPLSANWDAIKARLSG